ncbi:oligosaccharide flippase family protein [Cytophagaceae bacterium ABcell3]|nr:oligosaccharide flippase family protein [Cytophagaceae bacterium ABcell3]
METKGKNSIALIGQSVEPMGCLIYGSQYYHFQKTPPKTIVKAMLNFGKYTFGTNISSMLNRYIDQAMVGAMISTAGVAGYNAAIRISTLIEAPTLAIASVIFPETAKKMRTEGKKSIKNIYEQTFGSSSICNRISLFAVTGPTK